MGVFQLSFSAILVAPENTSIFGSPSTPGTLKGAAPMVGPAARRSTVRLPPGPMVRPVMRRLAPVPICARVERFERLGVCALDAAIPAKAMAQYARARRGRFM